MGVTHPSWRDRGWTGHRAHLVPASRRDVNADHPPVFALDDRFVQRRDKLHGQLRGFVDFEDATLDSGTGRIEHPQSPRQQEDAHSAIKISEFPRARALT